MFEIPAWLQQIFDRERFSCPSCGVKFNVEGLVSVGIRNIDHNNGGNRTKLWVEYYCKKCGQKVGYEIEDMDLRKLADLVLSEEVASIVEELPTEQRKSRVRKQRKKTVVKSKITQGEIKQMKKKLDEFNSFSQFLDMIGETPIDLSGKFKIGSEDVD